MKKAEAEKMQRLQYDLDRIRRHWQRSKDARHDLLRTIEIIKERFSISDEVIGEITAQVYRENKESAR